MGRAPALPALELMMTVARRLGWLVSLAGFVAVVAAVAGLRPDADERPGRDTAPGQRSDRIRESDLTTVLAPDSIPAIDEPRFVPPGKAGWIADREPVVAIEVNLDARAYPVQILTWHEIVNDVVGGEPVAITYCPLCNSALAFERVVDGRVLDYGTSGKLYNSALVMYDRQTGSYWLHYEGRAIIGELAGTRLEIIPVQMLSFGEWRRAHPEGMVLSRDTGYSRNYGQNPYDFYDSSEQPFLFSGEPDPRLPATERVVGVRIGGAAVAYPYSMLAEGLRSAAVVHDRVGGEPLVVFWRAGTASGLDNPTISDGKDVGAAGVFVPRAGGRALTFVARGDGFADRETGSVWSLEGRAVGGPLEGERLEPIVHLDAFWFAWQAYNPDTVISGS